MILTMMLTLKTTNQSLIGGMLQQNSEFRSQESGVEEALSLAFRLSCVPHQLENCCMT